MTNLLVLCSAMFWGAELLTAGTQRVELTVDGCVRSYIVHVPPGIAPQEKLPLVLVLHGAAMNGQWMMSYTGMNAKADADKFIAVYPDGTGFGPFLTWNAGGPSWGRPNDVKFLTSLVDDVGTRIAVDQRRVYATGLSNGGMMSYRLALEASGRIAAIAPIAGTMLVRDQVPTRAVPVMHFHGTADRIVPPGGPSAGTPSFVSFLSVAETLQLWCQFNRCDFNDLAENQLIDRVFDGTRVRKIRYRAAADGADVVYISIENGGHTWPGRPVFLLSLILGRTTRDVSANDLVWEFFQQNPLP